MTGIAIRPTMWPMNFLFEKFYQMHPKKKHFNSFFCRSRPSFHNTWSRDALGGTRRSIYLGPAPSTPLCSFAFLLLPIYFLSIFCDNILLLASSSVAILLLASKTCGSNFKDMLYFVKS